MADHKKPYRHWHFTVENFDTLSPPGPLAEHVEPAVALAAMRHCMTLRRPEGHFHSAWRHIEYAMNQNIDHMSDQIRRKYLGDAQWLLAGILGTRGVNASPDLYAQTLTLNSYLPVLTKRALLRPVTSSDCWEIYQSIGSAFGTVNAITKCDTSFRASRFAEMLGPALSARSRRVSALLYPSSPREEASGIQSLNHDGYFIKDGVKIPLQTKLIKTEKNYASPTQTIYVEPLASHALKRAGILEYFDPVKVGDCTLMMVELIEEELEGIIDDQGRQALDFMTRSVIGRYEYAAAA